MAVPVRKSFYLAEHGGYIAGMDTEGIGRASLALGAGRNTIQDEIDSTAGILLLKKTGDRVREGEVIAKLLTSDASKVPAAEDIFIRSIVFTEKPPRKRPLILDRIG